MKPYRLLLSAAVFFTLWWGVDLDRPETGAMAAVAGLMACLWLTEAIPLAVTALLPLVLFPLLGIAPTKAVAAKYMNATVFLLLGGFLIAQALERWQLHRRIALGVLGVFGGRPAAVLAGFVCATAFLSMWISNTASTLVMLPIALAVLLFLLPARREDGGRTTLLDAAVFARLPWGVVILFGGGFALASGFVDSGLSAWLAARLGDVAGIGRLGAVTLVAAGMTFLTELTSNTATTQLVLPLLASLAPVLHLDPVWLMLPAALSASCAFMFPVATPPNAIVFASGRLAIGDMVKTGLLLNLVGIAVVVALTSGLIPLLFEGAGG
ncbi:solute carrier family 13, member 2/3/5 [Methylomarinovum caldicuralii]|uniref:Solute carrier family 13, member 2/3/5 n=1 Tax=Methylomarinovum caldicuralii TaxID=438856 RepID=A0AAU9C4I4_9GAMM|nr:SLC13 family permease [Methylomarinovum caldicuralii]BCX82080.1 solute carrier family 13, member 2/3/5 [Methylomarinovum caldicuralii]